MPQIAENHISESFTLLKFFQGSMLFMLSHPPLEGSITFVMLTLHWKFVVNNRETTGIEGNTN